MSTTPSHTPVAVPSPSAAASRPTPPAPAQDPPLTDISGNVYEKITTFPHPLFVSPSAGKTYFLGTEQFAPGVDSLVRCTLLDHEALDARFYTKGTEQSVGISSMGLKVDQASFQLTKTNEDRTFALEFEHGLLCGVFDGHVGHQLSSHAVENFPCLLATALSATLAQHPASSASLSSALTSTIVGTFKAYDKEVGDTATAPFAAKPFSEWTEDEVREVLLRENDAVRRAMAGTTALVAFVTKGKDEVWVAGVGDCQCFIGRTVNGAWTTIPLNDEHNGKNPVEAARLRAEHPGEEETVVATDRVCGGIAVTRAFGDFTFKFAPDFTYNVLRYATPPFTRWANVEACLADSFTPPYLSAVASVYHENILPGDVLLLASDGLGDCPRVDALSAEEKAAAFTALAREGAGGEAVTSTLNGIGQKVGHGLRLEAGGENAATRVLKNTLWGDDAVKGSFELTAEVPEGEALQDDISVVIVQF